MAIPNTDQVLLALAEVGYYTDGTTQETVEAMENTMRSYGVVLVDKTEYLRLVLMAEGGADRAMAIVGMALCGVAGAVVGAVGGMLV